jgi:cystathionine beta-lyase/cystathionine gamma-synthase
MDNFNVTMSADSQRKLKVIAARKSLTLDQARAEMLERGIEDYIYRMQRNSRKAAELKAERAQMRKMEEKLAELGVEV